MQSKKPLTVVLILLVASSLLVATAGATVAIDTPAEYRGGEADHDQAVEISYTMSPVEEDIVDAQIFVQSTTDSFVDFDSFELTIEPGDADVDVTSVREGVFEIEEMEADEQVTVTFKAYPRDIKQEELPMAIIRVEYVQQGQSLHDTTSVTADLSNSPWFQLQEAPDPDDGNGVTAEGVTIGLIAGALLIGLGGFLYRQMGGDNGDGGGGPGERF